MTGRFTETEKIAGRRADFHVYYRRSGKPKLQFDAMFAETAAEAEQNLRGFARELAWGEITIVRTVPIIKTVEGGR